MMNTLYLAFITILFSTASFADSYIDPNTGGAVGVSEAGMFTALMIMCAAIFFKRAK